ncbi:MAG: hypothetical protein M0Z95_11280 [Actinomycetota bacterium]|nr:hypothetical protein [Actinomycetota bacterium]
MVYGRRAIRTTRWHFGVLVLASLTMSACATTGPGVSSAATLSPATVAGTWGGELYDATAGVLYTLTLAPEQGDRVKGTLQSITRTFAVHGHVASGELSLDLPRGEVLRGRVADGTWTGSFPVGDTRWRFRFTKANR